MSATSGAVQVSVVRAEGDSIRPPSSATRTSNGGLQSRSGRTGRENLPLAQKSPVYAPLLVITRTSIEILQVTSGRTGRESEFS